MSANEKRDAPARDTEGADFLASVGIAVGLWMGSRAGSPLSLVACALAFAATFGLMRILTMGGREVRRWFRHTSAED